MIQIPLSQNITTSVSGHSLHHIVRLRSECDWFWYITFCFLSGIAPVSIGTLNSPKCSFMSYGLFSVALDNMKSILVSGKNFFKKKC